MNTTETAIEEHNKYMSHIDMYCNNCGRKHEGRLIETSKVLFDSDNKPIDIVICSGPSYTDEQIVKQEYKEMERKRAQMIVDNKPWTSEEYEV